ncbi:MAG: hypothetical protein K1X64_21875, partial [Myxococcaceae bacterium]|nr:hypothetical protein [Myxococcaceae bacterium]
MNLKDFMAKYDRGSFFALANNNKISAGEVKAAGGYEQMAGDYKTLSSAEQWVVRKAMTDPAVRQQLDGWADPRVAMAVEAVDQGSAYLGGWIKTGRQDGRISKRELNDNAHEMQQGLRNLNDDEKLRLLEHVDDAALASEEGLYLKRQWPQAFDSLSFASVRSTDIKEQRKIEKVQNFLWETLAINPAELTEGFKLEHLAAFPVRTPATPEEGFVTELRKWLTHGAPLDIYAFHDFWAANYPKPPELTVGQLTQALALEPERFVGKRVTLKAYGVFDKSEEWGSYREEPVYNSTTQKTTIETIDDRETKSQYRFRDSNDSTAPAIRLVSNHDEHYDTLKRAARIGNHVRRGTNLGRFEVTGTIARDSGDYFVRL